jgi:hypothetical protein
VSPWRAYEKTYQLRLGARDWATVAERRDPLANVVTGSSEQKDPLSNLVTVRKVSGRDIEDKLRMLR